MNFYVDNLRNPEQITRPAFLFSEWCFPALFVYELLCIYRTVDMYFFQILYCSMQNEI